MSDWQTKQLGEVLQLNYGKGLSVQNRSPGSIPVYGSNGIVGFHNSALVQGPGVIVGRKGSAGEVHLCSGPFYPIDTTYYITPQDAPGTDIEFLYYLLKHLDLKRIKGDVGVPGLNREMAYLEPVSLPSEISEQKAIAHTLSTVQRAIAAQERIIQTTTELKKALMQKLFSEGLRGEPQKETEIGLVPESWEVVELESTGDVAYGIQAAVANNIAAIGTPILTNKNITLDGGFDLEKLNYYKLVLKRHRATILKKGDILFNWRSGSKNHVGKTAYFDLDGEWVHSSFILRIRPSEQINGRYLFYYFNHLREAEFFVKLQTYAINAKFNASAVNALPTAVPSRWEQDQITSTLVSVQTKIELASKKRRGLQDIFNTLLHELMTTEIRVHELEPTAGGPAR